ncbi:MAG TPA: ABC transporter permease [Gemmataceae bacterium]|jgi:molybdate transport system permease protein|nr:ABC transporter permease [Gemmataceae bacterium]
MTAAGANGRFYASLGLLGGGYVVLILAMVVADLCYTTPDHWWAALQSHEIQYAIKLTLVSCLMTAVLSLWVAAPLGYLLSRTHFWGRSVLETILDIPIVLPPLVIGLSLLILFQTLPGKWMEETTANRLGFLVAYMAVPILAALFCWPILRTLSRGNKTALYLPAIALVVAVVLRMSGVGTSIAEVVQARYGTRITFQIPAVILAQFSVSCAFAVRTMRVTFDQISPRTEQVALTLGCTRSQAFWLIALPEARRGLVSAGTLAWARALGEFGPILVFAGATRMRTEVLSTTVFLELSVGRLEAAIAVSLLMVVVAVGVLLLMRTFGLRGGIA